MNKIIIIVEGGLIQDISNIPHDIEIEVRDYDTDGADEENTKKDSDGDEYLIGIWR